MKKDKASNFSIFAKMFGKETKELWLFNYQIIELFKDVLILQLDLLPVLLFFLDQYLKEYNRFGYNSFETLNFQLKVFFISSVTMKDTLRRGNII